MPDGFATTPIAAGGIAEPRFREQLGEAQVLPTVAPIIPDIKKREEELPKEPKLPPGIHPPMRRHLQGEINDFYEKVIKEYPDRKKEISFKNEIEEFTETVMGIAEDSKKESAELSKLNTQFQIKGISAFENQANWDDIWSDEFFKQFKGDPIGAQVAMEQKRKGMTLKRKAIDLAKDFSSVGKRLITLDVEKNVVSWSDPKTGQITTTTTEEFKETGAKDIANMMLTNEPRFEQAQSEYNGLTPEEQEKYTDITDYYRQTYIDPFVKTEKEIRLKGVARKGLEINFGSATTPLYEFTERKIDIPVPQFGVNVRLPAGMDLKIVPTKALDITQIGGERGRRELSIFQPGFPNFKILTDPQYLLEIRGKKYILTQTDQFKADRKYAKKEGFEVGELVKETRDFLIPYDEYKKQFKAWSAPKVEQGFDWHQYEKAQQKKAPKKTTTLRAIRNLVGTRGYEDYTEEELIKYYTDQGYTIE